MKRFIIAAVAAFAIAGPVVAGDSLNVPARGVAKVAPQISVGDRGMALMSAAINSDGSIARGEGVVTSGTSRLGTGAYEVSFGRDITACAYSVTAGEATVGSANPRAVAVTRRAGQPNGVFLQIADSGGNTLDNAFFVLVFCGR